MREMTESEFIKKLEARAQEQRKIVETEILPDWAREAGEWLVVHPWRLLVPLSIILYALGRMVYGEMMTKLVLAIFGGFS